MATMTLKRRTPNTRGTGTYLSTEADREFLGVTDTAVSELEAVILAATATPDSITVGDEHPDDPACLCDRVTAEPASDNPLHWTIKAHFSTIPLTGSTPTDPLSRPPEVRWGFYTERRQIFLDKTPTTPKPIVNSAGERFQELPQRDVGYLTLTYARNESSPDFATLWQYDLVTNAAGFIIDGETIPAGKALLSFGEIPKIIENGVAYYRVTYIFRFNKDGWNPTKFLDVGYNELDAGDLSPILDTDGMPIRSPWPLDGSGAAQTNPTDTPAELDFNLFDAMDFSVFHFV